MKRNLDCFPCGLATFFILGGLVAWMLWSHLTRHVPTADELYGCTVAQQAPNGECQ